MCTPPLEIILRFWTNFPTSFARQNSTCGWVLPSLHFVLRVDARLTLGPAAAHGKRSAAMETQDPGPYRPWPHTGPVHIVNSQKWLKLQFWCYWNDWPLYGKKNYSTISYCKFELGILIIFINALFWETRTRKNSNFENFGIRKICFGTFKGQKRSNYVSKLKKMGSNIISGLFLRVLCDFKDF